MALDEVEKLTTAGGTNMWEGLELGLDAMNKDAAKKDKNTALLLLTDGMPDSNPKGYLNLLREYKEKNRSRVLSILLALDTVSIACYSTISPWKVPARTRSYRTVLWSVPFSSTR